MHSIWTARELDSCSREPFPLGAREASLLGIWISRMTRSGVFQAKQAPAGNAARLADEARALPSATTSASQGKEGHRVDRCNDST